MYICFILLVLPSFSIKRRYTNIEPVLNSIPIKLHRVFLSHNVVTVSSHYLIFHHHMYARQQSNRSILHAGRYLYDKEFSYLGTVIVTANVCRGSLLYPLSNWLSYKYRKNTTTTTTIRKSAKKAKLKKNDETLSMYHKQSRPHNTLS